jgi:Fe-S-cluster containining protein
MSSLPDANGIKSLGRCSLHIVERDSCDWGDQAKTLPTGSQLPVIADCQDCGACCLDVGAPPDYVALSLNPDLARDATFVDDANRLPRLPAEALRLLAAYLDSTESNPSGRNGVCVWFDGVTKRCGFYDWRPSTCRIFEISSPGCRLYRRRHGVESASVGLQD